MSFINKINIRNLTFSYDNPYKVIFEKINLEIDTNWKTIIIGKNGRGKSTLLNLIHGNLKSDKGEVDHNCRFSYFPFEVRENNENERVKDIIKENLGPYRKYEKLIEKYLLEGTEESLLKYGEIEEKYKNIDGYVIDSLIEREIEKMGLNLDILEREYETLSGGEKNRIKLIIIFLKKGYFPLIDEPTNHLDIEGRRDVAKYLSEHNFGFICISHDREFLNEIGDHILSIDNKRGIELRNEKYFKFEEFVLKRKEAESRKNLRLRNTIEKIEESAREKKKWGENKESSKFCSRNKKVNPDDRIGDRGSIGSKAAKMMKRAKNTEAKMEKEISEKKRLVAFMEKEYEIKFSIDKKLPKEVLRVDNLYITYEGKTVVKNLSFTVSRGERVALIGPNGSGKTSVLKALLGKLKDYEGLINYSNNIEISYLEQEQSYEEISLERYILDKGIDKREFGRFLASLDLRGEIMGRALLDFSQGEKRKIAMALNLYTGRNLYIWDEPLNFLDIHLRKKLEKAILKYEPTMIFVEHDRYFVERTATKTIDITKYNEG